MADIIMENRNKKMAVLFIDNKYVMFKK